MFTLYQLSLTKTKEHKHTVPIIRMHTLILRKIIKIVATRCQILRLKCTKFIFGWGSSSDPAGELTVLCKGREGGRRDGREGGRRGGICQINDKLLPVCLQMMNT